MLYLIPTTLTSSPSSLSLLFNNCLPFLPLLLSRLLHSASKEKQVFFISIFQKGTFVSLFSSLSCSSHARLCGRDEVTLSVCVLYCIAVAILEWCLCLHCWHEKNVSGTDAFPNILFLFSLHYSTTLFACGNSTRLLPLTQSLTTLWI